jgi:hypothetical protein
MFKKLGQFMGMVGIEVEVDVPESLDKDATSLEGKIRIVAEQDQTITKIKIEITQRMEEGSVGDEDRNIEKKTIGKIELSETINIKKGETKDVPFTLNFKRDLSIEKKLSEQSGVMGMLGKAMSYADNERWQFWVEALVDVKGAAFDPTGSKQVWFGN